MGTLADYENTIKAALPGWGVVVHSVKCQPNLFIVSAYISNYKAHNSISTRNYQNHPGWPTEQEAILNFDVEDAISNLSKSI